MKRNKGLLSVVVSADGAGVVSHAGTGLLRKVASGSGLTDGLTGALLDSYRGVPVHAPGRVFTDLACAVADGADCVSGIATLGDRAGLFGPVASMPTTWRLLERLDAAHLPAVRAARAAARARVWAKPGAGPVKGAELRLDIDATLVTAHSDKEGAAPTWKKGYGHHPLLCVLDRPEIAAGEALAGILRPGNAGSNTATDHVEVLDLALAQLPENYRPGHDDAPRVLVRCDTAGATHAFANACAERGVEFSFGFPVDTRVQRAVDDIPESCWDQALATGAEEFRDGAWVAEATAMINLERWPAGSRLILRRERPHPGAQLTFTDVNGYRVTAFLTNTPPGVIEGQAAGLELRHRQHARVEDRIREAKATGLRNFPCHSLALNTAWLEIVLTATDLIAWTQLLGFAGHALARVEIATFRYRVLHVAARLTRTARRTHLRIDQTWRWATHIATAYHRIHATFA